jgi:hypothetical protein
MQTPITRSGGIMVMAQRRKIGNLALMNPGMTTRPVIVPT